MGDTPVSVMDRRWRRQRRRSTFTTDVELVLVLGAGVLQQQADGLGQLHNRSTVVTFQTFRLCSFISFFATIETFEAYRAQKSRNKQLAMTEFAYDQLCPHKLITSDRTAASFFY